MEEDRKSVPAGTNGQGEYPDAIWVASRGYMRGFRGNLEKARGEQTEERNYYIEEQFGRTLYIK